MWMEITGGASLGILLGILEISWLSASLKKAFKPEASSSVSAIPFALAVKLVGMYGFCWGAFKLGLTKGLIAMIIAIALTMCIWPIKYLKGDL